MMWEDTLVCGKRPCITWIQLHGTIDIHAEYSGLESIAGHYGGGGKSLMGGLGAFGTSAGFAALSMALEYYQVSNWQIPMSTGDPTLLTLNDPAMSSPTALTMAPIEPSEIPASWMAIAWGQFDLAVSRLGAERETNAARILSYFAYTDASIVENLTADTWWCSAFANYTVGMYGIKGTNSVRAISWMNWGQTLKRPAYGAPTVVKNRGQWHVGFTVGAQNNRILLLGGNQGPLHAVTISSWPVSAVQRYAYPNGYFPIYIDGR